MTHYTARRPSSRDRQPSRAIAWTGRSPPWSPPRPPHPTFLARMSELNLRVVHVYGLTETYGPNTVCARPGRLARDSARAARQIPGAPGSGIHLVRSSACGRRGHEATSPRTGDDGRGDHARQYCHVRLLRGPAVRSKAFAAAGFTPATSPCGIPTEHRAARPGQRHHHFRRREHLHHRGRTDISAYPGVLECAVIGVPDAHWGETAEGVRRRSTTPPRRHPSTSSRSAASGSPTTSVPTRSYSGALPKTSTGKIQKFVLREPRVGRPGQADRRGIAHQAPLTLMPAALQAHRVRKHAAHQLSATTRIGHRRNLPARWRQCPDDPDFVVLADPNGNRLCVVDLSHEHG